MRYDTDRIKAALPLEDFARQTYGLEFDQQGRGRCPFAERHAHGDQNPSLHLDRQKGRIRCFSQNCFGERGVDLFGLVMEMEGIDFKTALKKLAERAGITPSNGKAQQQITAVFDYRDEMGKLLYRVVRLEPGENGRSKDFRAEQPDGRGGWVRNMKGVRLVLYRLPDLLKSDGPVVVIEGEKHADLLWEMGIPATCNPFGAQKWRPFYNDALKGRDVVLWPDRDQAGADHVQQVAESLHRDGKVKSIRVVTPPEDLPEKGDVWDGVHRQGWTREDVLRIIEGAQPWEPPKSSQRSSSPLIGEGKGDNRSVTLKPRGAADLIQNTPKVAWLIEKLLAIGRVLMMSGYAGACKTMAALTLALAVEMGSRWLGRFSCRKGRVLYIDEENGDLIIRDRLVRLLKGLGRPEDGSDCEIQFLTMAGVDLSDGAIVGAIAAVLSEGHYDLVIIDTFFATNHADENSAYELRPILDILKGWMNAYGCAFCLLHHRRKPAAGWDDSQHAYRGSSALKAFVDAHLDMTPVKDKDGAANVRHVKARMGRPVEPFAVEVVDLPGDGLGVGSTEAQKPETTTRLEEAQTFILGLTETGERVTRKEIADKGGKAGFSEKLLDTARTLLVEMGKLETEKVGRETFVWRSEKQLSPSPTPYRGEGDHSDDLNPVVPGPWKAPAEEEVEI